MRPLFFAVSIVISILIIGCSGTNPMSPVEKGAQTPETNQNANLPVGVSDYLPDGTPAGGQGFLGLFSVNIDVKNLKGEIAPLRSSALTDVLEVVDITNFMTLAPCSNCVKLKGVSLDTSGNLVLSLGVKHPFAAGDPFKPITGRNRADLSVFNVEGIVLADGGNPISFPGLAQTVEAVKLVNADGYTGYLDSQLDAIFPTAATVHPYILHFDDYSQGNFDPGNPWGFQSVTDPPPTGNLIMAMGCDYKVQDYVFDITGTNFNFMYAVGCTYGLSAATKSDRFQPQYRVPQFLKKAASEVHVELTRNDFMAGNPLSNADIEIKVVDKSQGVTVGEGLDQMFAQSDVSAITVDLPGILTNPAIVPLTPISGTGHDPSDPLVYKITVLNEQSAPEGTYWGLVKVLDSYPVGSNGSPLLEGKDGIKRVDPLANPLTGLFDLPEFATYQTFWVEMTFENDPPIVGPVTGCLKVIAGHPFPFHVTANDPNLQPLTYYWDNGEHTPGVYDDGTTTTGDVNLTFSSLGNYTVDVQVDDGFGGVTTSSDPLEVTVIPDGVFVDADNAADPGKNGTWDHPWDTIQKGIDNVPFNANVYVFPATAHYAPFSIKSNQTVMGFDPECGLDRPQIDETDSWTYASGVSNFKIDSLIFSFDINTAVAGDAYIFNLQSASNATIRNCKFTGESEAVYTYVLKMDSAVNTTVEECEFVSILANRIPDNYRVLEVMQGSGCTSATIKNNELHDIGIPNMGPETTWSEIYGMVFGGGSSSLVIKNNLLYNFWDYSPTIIIIPGDSCNVITGMFAGNYDTLEINHNTMDNFDCNNGNTAEHGWTDGFYGGMDSNFVMKNNIFKSTRYYIGPTMYHWSAGFWMDSSTAINADYSCVFWGNPAPGGSTQVASYLNMIHKGTGSYDQTQLVDPDFDYTPGPNYYHPKNTLVSTGGEGGTEMGAFGGPDGDWTPPSQIYN